MMTVFRRVLWLALLGGAGFAGWSAWQRRSESVGVVGTAVWPPFEPSGGVPASAPSGDERADEGSDDGSVDASHTHPPRWVAPVDGACPSGYPVKANDNSGIFHVPGGRFYERTVPERCYADAADAEADGYRRSKA